MKQNALPWRFLAALLFFSNSLLSAQNTGIKGQLQSPNAEAVGFATLGVYLTEGGELKKAGASDESGIFELGGLAPGVYVLKVNALGFGNYLRSDIRVEANQLLDLGVITLNSSEISLDEVTVTASRVMVEVKPDRTIFNVEGTINSTGSDAITLLRKAPNVTVDNNDNISVLGRSGVLLYVDGKRLPLTGADLTNYLQNLPAEQLDRIEIITNPGAKYEAEGNAGIIDIRMKRDQNLGANGSLNATASQGHFHRANLSGTVN
ncbi:MAG TPA: TonB-dependent receptor, partial [Saprospirales bacterium]|nr:TonB-dependent receptor [Saprospirales bacterium]